MLNSWKKRNLTPLGKIVVIKSFVISNFTHLFTSIPSPTKHTYLELSKLIYSFIWDNKPHKISKHQLTNDYEHRGLKMINLENHMLSQKLSWIKRMLNSSDAPWTKLCTKTIDSEKLYTLGPMWSEQLVKKFPILSGRK